LGLINYQVKLLLDAYRAGTRMDRVLMIGRQSLFLHPSELRELRKTCPQALPNYQWGEYADRFFKECLKVAEVNTLDYSAYEGADLLHDLNQPIRDHLQGKFDVVVEAGSLEHVFNFPIAIANLMRMTRVGGMVSVSTPSNNLCGHGFYQFSPELIFRVFTPKNGFKLGPVFALKARYPGVELIPISDVFELMDPADAGARIGLVTKAPVLLLFHARKVADVPLFVEPPMQSDYAAAWFSPQGPAVAGMPCWISKLPFYSSLRVRWKGRKQAREFSLKNGRAFRRAS